MNIFLKAAACILAALIIWISLGKQNKDFSVLLSIVVCTMVFTVAATFLQPVIQFVKKLQALGELNGDMITVILKSVGIGIIGEICVSICKDAGNESLGKAIQFLSATVVLWISIPVFEKLLTLLDNILGSI